MAFESKQFNQDFTKCPKCGEYAYYVLETRTNREYTRRRRHCRTCGHRATFYEVSQERYKKFQKDSKELEGLLNKLRDLLGEPEPKKAKKPKDACSSCWYVKGDECSLGFPEAFTPEAHDCSAYIAQT